MPSPMDLRSNVIPLLGVLGVVIAIVAVLIYAFRKKPDPPVKHDDTPYYPERGPIGVKANNVTRFSFMRPRCPGDERFIVDSAQYTEKGIMQCIGQSCNLDTVTDITGAVQNIFDSAPGAVMTEKDIGRPLGGTLELKMHCP